VDKAPGIAKPGFLTACSGPVKQKVKTAFKAQDGCGYGTDWLKAVLHSLPEVILA